VGDFRAGACLGAGCRAGQAGFHGPWCFPFLVGVAVLAVQPDGRACRRVTAAVISPAHGQRSASRSPGGGPRAQAVRRRRTGVGGAVSVPSGGRSRSGRASASTRGARRPGRRSRTRRTPGCGTFCSRATRRTSITWSGIHWAVADGPRSRTSSGFSRLADGSHDDVTKK
jgi:hypothetical protein